MKDVKPLPCCEPEKTGVRSEHILNFINRLERNGLNMHGYILIRRGLMIAEGYWSPFGADQLHRMYSVSKTFTSAAIGLLCDEGKISLSDKITEFFPDKLPQELHPYVAQTTIRDLLIMATPYTYPTYGLQYKDWAWTFFNTKPSHPPGTIFSYDTSGSFILNVIVERVTGKPYLEYMKDRMLREMGFSEDAWCVKSPEGYSWGGSGVMCTQRDLAKFALLFLNGGRYEGRQLLSEEYLKAAVSKQIDNKTSGFDDETCHSFGYGYQIWRTRDGSFSFLGMGDQLAVCIPEKDMLFVCTADNQGYDKSSSIIYNALWDEIVNLASDGALAADGEAYQKLKEKNASLVIKPLKGGFTSPYADKVNGVIYRLEENRMKISRTRLNFENGGGVWEYRMNGEDKKLGFGIGHIEAGLFPHTEYFGDTIGKPSGREYKYLASGAWVEEHKFMLRVFITDDYFGNMTAVFSYKDGGAVVGLYFSKTAEWFLDEYSGFAGGYADGDI